MRGLNLAVALAVVLHAVPCVVVRAEDPKPAREKSRPIAPAEKLAEGWDEIDQRLIFLMVRLANTEASLDAIDKTIGDSGRKHARRTGESKEADKRNEEMDRRGGGPVRWSEFYGTTAEKFFYHPVDQNTTYHTTTVLTQRPAQEDNQKGSGVPSRQGLPVHQRPPQFDYIYRANESAKARAEEDAAKLRGKMSALVERRQRLEAEQAELWCEIAFHAIAHYDLNKRPLYRFEPIVGADTSSRQHAEVVKAAAQFMRLALSIIESAHEDQAGTFSKTRNAISDAREKLGDAWLRQGIDVADRKSAESKFAALAKRLDDMASNLSDSYVVAVEGDREKDQQRKDTFRRLLQESLVNYAQIILALDEMAVLLRDEWQIKPDLEKPIAVIMIIDPRGRGAAKGEGEGSGGKAPGSTGSSRENQQKSPAEQSRKALATFVKLSAPYAAPEGGTSDRISVQYAVIEVAKQAGLRYDFNTSLRNTDPACRRWVTPDIQNKTCEQAFKGILDPVGLTYKINDGVVVLQKK